MSELLRRRGEDFGGGDQSAYNYDLYCGECKALLGPLGVFVTRSFTRAEVLAVAVLGVPAGEGNPYRRAHCGHCHAQTFVTELDRRVDCFACPKTVDACLVCGRAPGDRRPLTASS